MEEHIFAEFQLDLLHIINQRKRDWNMYLQVADKTGIVENEIIGIEICIY